MAAFRTLQQTEAEFQTIASNVPAYIGSAVVGLYFNRRGQPERPDTPDAREWRQ